MIPRSLLNRFIPAIKPLERQLLERLSSELQANAQAILQRQVASINMAQRHTDCKEVCYYRMRWGRPRNRSGDAFPFDAPEVKLATASFMAPDGSCRLDADFWLVQGFLFSITFNHSPRAYLSSRDVYDIGIFVHCDPMTALPKNVRTTAEVALSGWVAEWNQRHALSALNSPLSAVDRENMRNKMPEPIPQDYLELTMQTEGAVVGPCVIYGLSTVRQVVLPDATYHVLAETQDSGVIAIREGSRDGMLYFCDYTDKVPVPVGRSFRDAVDQSLNARRTDLG